MHVGSRWNGTSHGTRQCQKGRENSFHDEPDARGCRPEQLAGLNVVDAEE